MAHTANKRLTGAAQAQRAESVMILFGAAAFSVPILNVLLGALTACRLLGVILGRSNQVLTDLFWAVIGGIVMCVGFAMPFIVGAHDPHGGEILVGMALDFVINFVVLRGILFGKLRHL